MFKFDKISDSFKKKLLFSFIIVAFIPLCIFASVSGFVFVHQEKNTMDTHLSQIVSQVSNSIDVYISTIDKIIKNIDLTIQDSDFIISTDEQKIDSSKEYLTAELKNIADSHKEIAGIIIAKENDDYISTGVSRISSDPFSEEDWYQMALKNPDQFVILSSALGRNIETNKSYSVDDVFSVAKAIVDPKTNDNIGVILIDIKHDIIMDSINMVSIGEKSFVYVIDDFDNVVYAPWNKVIYRINSAWINPKNEPFETKKIDGISYQFNSKKSNYTGWRVVGVFSLEEVMKNIYYITYILIFCVIISVLFIIFISLRLSYTITDPILQLKNLMGQAENGDLTVRFVSKKNDEISQLGNNFNQMIEQIDELIKMVYLEQQSKKNAELKSLQEQIKPHFLYNTLDTISWMARDYSAEDIVKLVDALTNMFRIGLSHGKDFITVTEEIKHITNYLYIQKIRYKDKLNYEIDVDKDIMDYKLPKLILQPLVENAIYHGIKQNKKGGIIHITSHIVDENKYILSVSDNGPGIEPEKVYNLNFKLNNKNLNIDKQSFGLFYIQERIRLSYGQSYGISIDSEKGKGTRVSIILPSKN